ncbi:MAG: hypothetical protein ACT4QG_07860 [Sporichthyaceae bacterium]
MAIEDSPIYDLLISELGSPIADPAIDCSYAFVLNAAGQGAGAPAKAPSVLTPRSAPKPLAPMAAKNAS